MGNPYAIKRVVYIYICTMSTKCIITLAMTTLYVSEQIKEMLYL